MTELEKYIGIYQSPEFTAYGHDNCGSRSMPLIEPWNVSSVLDVGCGWNEFAKNFRKKHPSVIAVGVDFACSGADVIASATSLPFADKEFDLVTSFDALEHLLPDEVPVSLQEMSRVSRKFCFSICYRASVFLWMGENLHPTVRPEEWWMEEISKIGGNVQKSGRFLFGEWTTK